MAEKKTEKKTVPAPRKPREAHDLASASALLKKAKAAAEKADERYARAEREAEYAHTKVRQLKDKVDEFYNELMRDTGTTDDDVSADLPEASDPYEGSGHLAE